MKTIKNKKGIETLIFAETFEFEAYAQIKKPNTAICYIVCYVLGFICRI